MYHVYYILGDARTLQAVFKRAEDAYAFMMRAPRQAGAWYAAEWRPDDMEVDSHTLEAPHPGWP
jgi:hypothetical protein